MKAVQSWEISRVTLDLEGTPMILMEDPKMGRFTHGEVCHGQIDLRYDEAEMLIAELQAAVDFCRDLDKQLEEDSKTWGDE